MRAKWWKSGTKMQFSVDFFFQRKILSSLEFFKQVSVPSNFLFLSLFQSSYDACIGRSSKLSLYQWMFMNKCENCEKEKSIEGSRLFLSISLSLLEQQHALKLNVFYRIFLFIMQKENPRKQKRSSTEFYLILWTVHRAPFSISFSSDMKLLHYNFLCIYLLKCIIFLMLWVEVKQKKS